MQGPPSTPPWDDVRIFLALCRARTVGGAARALGVDASTVSRRLAALEDELASTLFERGRGGIAPTDAARELMPLAEQMEAAMLRFASAADGLERDVSGLVRITCPADLAEVVLVPLLPALLRAHPRLRVDVSAGESLLDLARREADLALRVVRPAQGDLVVTRVRTVRWVVAAAPKLARTLGTLRAWGDTPWIGWGERLGQAAPAQWLRAHAADREPVVCSDSLRVQLASAAAGLGVVLVPEASVAPFGLVPVALAGALRRAAAALPVDELLLVTHRALRDVPRVRVVWELLVERLRQDAPA